MAPIRRVKAACQKCRSLRHRCDFKYPKCSRCERANIDCVVQDPITKIHKLRLEYGPPPDIYKESSQDEGTAPDNFRSFHKIKPCKQKKDIYPFEVGLTSICSMPFGFKAQVSTTDISMFAKYNCNETVSSNGESTKLVKLPSRQTTKSLVINYFKYSWTQYPIIANDNTIFVKIDQLFNDIESQTPTKSSEEYLDYLIKNFSSLDIFMIYMLIAIGSCVTNSPSVFSSLDTLTNQKKQLSNMKPKLKSNNQSLNYFNTATIFFNKFLKIDLPNLKMNSNVECSNSQLKSVQCTFLLASFGLFSPIKPGIWYILLVTTSMVLDLNLYCENTLTNWEMFYKNQHQAPEINVRNLNLNDLYSGNYKQLHRLVFWSCYSLERQICCYVNKPFVLSDSDITSCQVNSNNSDYENFIIPVFFINLRMFQGKIHQFVNGSKNSEFSLINYRNIDEFSYQTHTSLNKLMDKYLDRFTITKNSKVKVSFQFTSDFAILNYSFLLQSLYKPTEFRVKLDSKELELLFKVANQIVTIYSKLNSAGKINFKYLSVHSIHQASVSYFYALCNSKKIGMNCKVLKYFDEFYETVRSLLDDLSENCVQAITIRNGITKFYSVVRNKLINHHSSKGFDSDENYLCELLSTPNGLQSYIIVPISKSNNDEHSDDSINDPSIDNVNSRKSSASSSSDSSNPMDSVELLTSIAVSDEIQQLYNPIYQHPQRQLTFEESPGRHTIISSQDNNLSKNYQEQLQQKSQQSMSKSSVHLDKVLQPHQRLQGGHFLQQPYNNFTPPPLNANQFYNNNGNSMPSMTETSPTPTSSSNNKMRYHQQQHRTQLQQQQNEYQSMVPLPPISPSNHVNHASTPPPAIPTQTSPRSYQILQQQNKSSQQQQQQASQNQPLQSNISSPTASIQTLAKLKSYHQDTSKYWNPLFSQPQDLRESMLSGINVNLPPNYSLPFSELYNSFNATGNFDLNNSFSSSAAINISNNFNNTGMVSESNSDSFGNMNGFNGNSSFEMFASNRSNSKINDEFFDRTGAASTRTKTMGGNSLGLF